MSERDVLFCVAGKYRRNKRATGAKVFDILDTELRTADVEVRMPVVMKQEEKKKWHSDTEYTILKDENGNPIMVDKLYAPQMTEDGKYLVDTTQKMHNLEEHTLCWLIKKNRSGELTEFGLRDAFYQDLHYDWGRQNVDVSKIEVVDGKPEIPAGYIPAENHRRANRLLFFKNLRYITAEKEILSYQTASGAMFVWSACLWTGLQRHLILSK